MFGQLPLLAELGEVKLSQCQKNHGYPKVNLILLLSHIMINKYRYIFTCTSSYTETCVSAREGGSMSTGNMSWWQQAGGHATAPTACQLPDPVLVNTNKGHQVTAVQHSPAGLSQQQGSHGYVKFPKVCICWRFKCSLYPVGKINKSWEQRGKQSQGNKSWVTLFAVSQTQTLSSISRLSEASHQKAEEDHPHSYAPLGRGRQGAQWALLALKSKFIYLKTTKRP